MVKRCADTYTIATLPRCDSAASPAETSTLGLSQDRFISGDHGLRAGRECKHDVF